MLLLGVVLRLESALPPPPALPAPPPGPGRASGCRARHNTAPPAPGPPPRLHAPRAALRALGLCLLLCVLVASLQDAVKRTVRNATLDVKLGLKDAAVAALSADGRRRLLDLPEEGADAKRVHASPRLPPGPPGPPGPAPDANCTERADRHALSAEALWSVVAVISLAVVVLAALGVVSCLVSHQRPVPGGMGGEPPLSTLPMLALHSGMERVRLEAGVGAGAVRERRAADCAVDRAVRLAAVAQDLQLDLPPSIALPDGEEIPYGSSARLHIRDPEQESEIYQKCIRPPPNRTVFDGESPPPYRPSSRQPPPLLHPAAPSVGLPAAGHAGHAPSVIVPPRTAPGSGATGKHSTAPAPPPSYSSSAAAAAAAASGLARLLTPSASPAAEWPERAVTVPVSSRTARSVELVNASDCSDAAHPAVRDIPGTWGASATRSPLAALTMVPCLTESRTESPARPWAPEAPAPGRTRSATARTQAHAAGVASGASALGGARTPIKTLPRPPV